MSGADRLRRRIALEGPMPVETFMALALYDPEFGFYRTRDPLGAAGDFVTAPEIAQIFGEMIGIFFIDAWQALGEPEAVRLLELGPGRGTLMADILRVGRMRPRFLTGLHVSLVETNPVLSQVQADVLKPFGVPISWHERLEEVPRELPLLAIANEFFDALPVRQSVMTGEGWRERHVGLGEDGAFVFVAGAPVDPIPSGVELAPPGAILEASPMREAVMGALANRLSAKGGRALIIDYGYEGPALGDTLQAMQAHRFVDPLEAPGEADLTAHVDFAAIAAAARAAGAYTQGPVPQGLFLQRLGIVERAEMLARRHPDRRTELGLQLARLTGRRHMGSLFHVLAVTATPDIAPGFA